MASLPPSSSPALQPPSSDSPPSSSSAPGSSNVIDSYLGSHISLISKFEIRYEGVLYRLDVQDSTLALKDVRSYGTEGRKKDGPQVPASEKVYDFILFRGSDIKDLQVKTPLSTPTSEQIYEDPAIIQSQYVSAPLSSSAASIARNTSMESSQVQNAPAPTIGTYSAPLPSRPPEIYPSTLSQATQTVSQPLSSQMYWQGYSGTPVSRPAPANPLIPFNTSSIAPSSFPMQHQVLAPGPGDSPVMGLLHTSEAPSIPSNVSNAANPSFSHSLMPPGSSSSPLIPPSAFTVAPQVPLSAYGISGAGDLKTGTNQNVSSAESNPVAMPPFQPMPYSASSQVSTPNPLISQLPYPSSLNQFPQSSLFPMQSMYSTQNSMMLNPPSLASSSLISSAASQAPLLPLPSTTQTMFSEEFDFEAMNEKFKKDEVWGHMGKAKPNNEVDILEGQQNVAPHLPNNFDPQPAYKKDDFFDTISCHSRGRGRNGQFRFSDRMRHDTETFGSFDQRPNMGYGRYNGPGRGYNSYNNGSQNWGRGYGYGGRGQGNMHF
ncbi:Decapping 5-like protein [Linum grandiflorum]